MCGLYWWLSWCFGDFNFDFITRWFDLLGCCLFCGFLMWFGFCCGLGFLFGLLSCLFGFIELFGWVYWLFVWVGWLLFWDLVGWLDFVDLVGVDL